MFRRGVGKMAQSVEYIPRKHGQLSLGLSDPWEKPSIEVNIHNPSPGEEEAEGSLGLSGQPASLPQFVKDCTEI